MEGNGLVILSINVMTIENNLYCKCDSTTVLPITEQQTISYKKSRTRKIHAGYNRLRSASYAQERKEDPAATFTPFECPGVVVIAVESASSN